MPRLFIPMLLLFATSALADVTQDAVDFRGGAFLAEHDSLSFDEFRALEGSDQLERGKLARSWLKRSRELMSLAYTPREAESKERLLRAAVDQIATAVGTSPYIPELWLQYARLSHDLGRYGDASYCLRQSGRTLRFELSDDKRADLEAEFHRLSAIVSYNTDNLEGSRDAARTALEFNSKDSETRLLLARCLIELEEFSEARDELRAFGEDDPAYARSLSILGILEMRAGQFDIARDAFQRAYKYGMRGATFDNDWGRLYLEMERYDDAAGKFSNAIESVPSFLEARSNLGVAHRRAGKETEAEAVWHEALQLNALYGPVHFNLAELYRDQIELAPETDKNNLASLAFEHYSLALQGGYDADVVMERRARLALNSDDLRLAESDLLKATENPRFGDRVLLLLARVKKQQGRLEIAQDLLEMAEQKGSVDPLVFSELGEVRLRRFDYEGARDALVKACELGPELVVTRVNLSIAHMELGELEAASAALSEAELLAPRSEAVQHQKRVLGDRM